MKGGGVGMGGESSKNLHAIQRGVWAYPVATRKSEMYWVFEVECKYIGGWLYMGEERVWSQD